MVNITKGCAVAFMACLPVLAAAESEVVSAGQDAIKASLNHAVVTGHTIDEAVADAVTADPVQGEEITVTALNMLQQLPRTACATRAQDGGIRLAVWPDFQACANRVIHAAITAGVDPTRLMQASAAGAPDAKGHDANPGIDLYLRRLLLVGGS